MVTYSLVPKLCLGTHLRETPVSRSPGGLNAVRETEFRGQCVPKQSLGTRAEGRRRQRPADHYRPALTCSCPALRHAVCTLNFSSQPGRCKCAILEQFAHLPGSDLGLHSSPNYSKVH